jgi:hypothetical protein
VAQIEVQAPSAAPWPTRLQTALLGDEAEFAPEGVQERSVLTELRDWIQPVMGATPSLRLCLLLQLPPEDSREFTLQFALQKTDESAVMVLAHDLFTDGAAAAARLNCDLRVAQEQLLQMLAVASRTFVFIENELRKPRPEA